MYLENILSNNDTIVLAISGGPDSMYLANLILKLKSKLNLNIIIAHVNHNLRKESLEEEQFVKDFAKDNNLKFAYLKIEKYQKENFQNEARRIRYNFFFEIMAKYHAKYLMTAHHGDDLIETILMRLSRGATLKSYAGIPLLSEYNNYKIIRPLIFLTKEEIKNYMDQNHLKYFIDSSNLKDTYTRNRYRKYILPLLKKENKDVHLKYLNFSNELLAANEYIDKQVYKVYSDVYHNKEIDILKIKNQDEYIGQKVIEKILADIYNNDILKITSKHKIALENLINSTKAHSKINLPNNITFIKEYNIIRLHQEKKTEEFQYILNDKVKLSTGSIEIIEKSTKTDNYHLYLNSREIKLPLIVRSRKNGDKMAVKNLNGHKKIKDILMEEKIVKEKRDQIPLVTDSENNILWLPGIKKSKFDKAKTKNYDIILKYIKKEGE